MQAQTKKSIAAWAPHLGCGEPDVCRQAQSHSQPPYDYGQPEKSKSIRQTSDESAQRANGEDDLNAEQLPSPLEDEAAHFGLLVFREDNLPRLTL